MSDKAGDTGGSERLQVPGRLDVGQQPECRPHCNRGGI